MNTPPPPPNAPGHAGPAPSREERRFLEGPYPRRREMRFLWTVLREFLRGFRALQFVGPCVSVFGSARVAESSPYYALARELGAGLSRQGFTVMTGGGPGIMEAANRGAREAGAPRWAATSCCRTNKTVTPTSTRGSSASTSSCARCCW
ncbi:LOG family protein [Hymenobacter humi]|uniref:LOG family protein n=1 Tax=Hymenobacter humi TaxID=1411620 RepID=A0ABW2UC15_9BACT